MTARHTSLRHSALPGARPLAVDWRVVSTVLAAALVLSGALEFLLLRLVTRSLVHIPGIGVIDGPFTLLAESGRLAYYAATVLLVVLLLGFALRAAARRSMLQSAAALGLGLFTTAAAAALAGAVTDLQLGVLSLVAIALLLPRALISSGMRGALPVSAFAMAFALVGAFTLAPLIGARSPADTLLAGEALALIFAITSPLLITAPRDRKATAVAALIGLIVLVGLIGNPAASKNLALWSIGLAGYFPATAYALGAGALAYSLTAGLRHDGSRSMALGLALLILGGLGFHSTYQTGLVIAGLAVIGEGAALPVRTAAGRRAI